MDTDVVTRPDAARPSAVTSRWVRGAVLAVPAIMIAVGGWVHRWTDEDAFINFRIVDQLFAGNGPVFNAGERIETYTSALWLAVLSLGRITLGWLMGPEWISVLLGLAAATAGFAVAAGAARRLHPDGRLLVPVGLLAAAAVPVMWDFATSGLEMGLVWLWIAGSFAVLTRFAPSGPGAAPAPPTRRFRTGALVLIGLGPLVRPDLGLMTAAFLGGWFLLVRPRRVVHDLAASLAVPVAYQVFRMGYFAALVPSTALAKDSGGLHLRQGWAYLTDLVGAYGLVIPLVVIGAVIIALTVGADRRLRIVTLVPVVAAALHAGYMVASGGDYMHGRLLLPALFALAVPATIPIDPGRSWHRAVAVAGAVVVVAWSAVVVIGVRYDQPPVTTFEVLDVADWRQLMNGEMFHHPASGFGLSPAEMRDRFEAGERGYLRVLETEPRPGRDSDRLVVTLGSIGFPGWKLGPEIHVVDIGGLAEPLAARATPIDGRAAGHRKSVSATWYDARFGGETGGVRVRAARRALRCGQLGELMDAVGERLTLGRFLSNLWKAPALTVMHVPRDPRVAAERFCGSERPEGP